MERFKFTKSVLDTALSLRAEGLGWSAVADRLLCGEDSLKHTVSRYRDGRWRGISEIREREREEIERMIVQDGRNISQIARARHVSPPAISVRCSRMGLDDEIRVLLRAEYLKNQEKARHP